MIVKALQWKFRDKIECEDPKYYDVILLDDNYTTMEFVIEILINIFGKHQQDATKIMLCIHNNGQAKIASYIYDIAITKCAQVKRLARKNGFPLKAIVEVV